MKRVLFIVLALVIAAPVGTFVYFNFIAEDAPDKLSLEGDTPGTTSGAPASPDVAGTWKATSASQVGYRVDEVAFGQQKTAAGRTNKVDGTMVIEGQTVKSVHLSVDMASVESDESRRDNQFRGRIMSVSQFPTATFKLTSPITLTGTTTATAKATGELTLRGKTRPVTFDLSAKRQGDDIAVQGLIPIVFEEWGIPNPSFASVSTEDHGELEFLVVFART